MRDPEQARLLTDTRSKLYFAPFLAQERTVAAAAKEAGCSLAAMFYRVGTFCRAGLLRVTREEKRAGRAVKHYRSVADAYFIPFELTPYAGLEERIKMQLEPLWQQIARECARQLRESEQAGQHLFRDGSGTVWTDTAPSQPGGEKLELPQLLLHDVTLALTEAQVADLQQQLRELSTRYQELSRQGQGKTYLLQLALVPLAGQSPVLE